jgi:hypothetical protein
MSRFLAGKPDLYWSARYALLAITRAASPYEPDPTFDDPVIRRRVGEVIAKAMERK